MLKETAVVAFSFTPMGCHSRPYTVAINCRQSFVVTMSHAASGSCTRYTRSSNLQLQQSPSVLIRFLGCCSRPFLKVPFAMALRHPCKWLVHEGTRGPLDHTRSRGFLVGFLFQISFLFLLSCATSVNHEVPSLKIDYDDYLRTVSPERI